MNEFKKGDIVEINVRYGVSFDDDLEEPKWKMAVIVKAFAANLGANVEYIDHLDEKSIVMSGHFFNYMRPAIRHCAHGRIMDAIRRRHAVSSQD